MLKYFFKKGMYNLIAEKYDFYLYVFENEIKNKLPKKSNLNLSDFMNKNSCLMSPATFYREMIIRYKQGKTTPEESLYVEASLERDNVIKKAEQEYYEVVFNSVCQEISKKLNRFETMLPLNLSAFNLPKKLTACTIYEFVYFCQYGERIDFTLDYQNIVCYVRKLKDVCLRNAEK